MTQQRFRKFGDAKAQTNQAMQNVSDLLQEAGSKLEHVGGWGVGLDLLHHRRLCEFDECEAKI